MENEKLQKIIAHAGLSSRREAEVWIKAGRVSVNGSIAELGDRAGPKDKIRVDGKLLQVTAKEDFVRRMLVYHKPEGEICSRKDPEGRPTIFDTLPNIKNGRWLNVGRLDINTSGLIFFTNDGELANRLMHPSHQVLRKYAVRVRGEVTEQILAQLVKGVELEDGMAHFEKVEDAGGEGTNHWYNVILREGKNREVRRLWEAFDIQVSRLHRIQYGNFNLPRSLKRGRWRELTHQELGHFEEMVGLKKTVASKVIQQANRKRQKNKTLKARKTFRK
ncbi:23S rRNA pseudouridine(2605) synthase RluB [Aliikangiella marina]|uniref:Pseudouridine synthase n=1 Tax=Aliikangiella marina TaxID=1712262 RepID=A0A545TH40_9GAMM|nr:23S rRNA pseudouridine(2605) synthase RluB [Aliikangiella marina]TQV76554.1 23S rRNA pseudouridine(2605) synthase RluB [Aliikangiella marina]